MQPQVQLPPQPQPQPQLQPPQLQPQPQLLPPQLQPPPQQPPPTPFPLPQPQQQKRIMISTIHRQPLSLLFHITLHLTHSLHYPMWREGKRQLDHKNIFCRTCPARSDKGKGGVAP